MLKKSKFLSIGTKDFIKGSIVAVLIAVGTFLQTVLTAGSELNYKQVLISAVIGFISYLVKNLLTNSRDEILKPENS
jgi:hypothetical protein